MMLKGWQAQRLNPQYLSVLALQEQSLRKADLLITSGGTSVPLQKHCVRSIQNFSTGKRGALLCERALESGHTVIFFYKDKGYIPYSTDLDWETLMQQDAQQLDARKTKFRVVKERLIKLKFTTVYEYLYGLEWIVQRLGRAVVILAAAVSDFIPEVMSNHKISAQNLQLNLGSVPKVLGLLQKINPHIRVCSFKLETEQKALLPKMKQSIEQYSVDWVVGNVLATRYQHVCILFRTGNKVLLTAPDIEGQVIALLFE